MRFKRKPEKKYECWHNWFAWFPIEINNQWVWLETVERSGYFHWESYDWKYRLKES